MLKKRGNTWWVMTTLSDKRIRKSTGCTDLAEAEQRLPEILADALSEVAEVAFGGLTLGQGFQKLMKEEWSKTSDRKMVQTRMDEISSILGADLQLASLTRDHLLKLQTVLAALSGRKPGSLATPATVNRKMAVLTRLLNVAVDEWKVLAARPRVRPFKVPNQGMRGITDNEIELLFKHTLPKVHDVWKILIETGMRVGEWNALRWRHIDFENGFINLIPSEVMHIKTNQARTIPMTSTARVILQRRRKEGLITPFADVGRESLRYQWDHARTAMGLDHDKGFVTHALRHTCATRLVNQGVPTSSVQKWLGHASIMTTEKYIQQSAEDLKQYAKCVEVLTHSPKLQAIK